MHMKQNDDARLISQSLDDNHEAYRQLVDRYKDALYRHSFRIVHDEDTATDIAQDTFVTAYYKLSSYNPEYAFGTWLFKIATNKALSELKKQTRHSQLDDYKLSNLISQHAGPKDMAEKSEVRAAVEKLPTNYRTAISLHYWEGLSQHDVAFVMKVPIGSVKGWLSRAKVLLRKELS